MDQYQNENEWTKTEDGFEYKNIRKNGHWEVIRWRHDAAYYSFCPFCGYMHSCYKNNRDKDGALTVCLAAICGCLAVAH